MRTLIWPRTNPARFAFSSPHIEFEGRVGAALEQPGGCARQYSMYLRAWPPGPRVHPILPCSYCGIAIKRTSAQYQNSLYLMFSHQPYCRARPCLGRSPGPRESRPLVYITQTPYLPSRVKPHRHVDYPHDTLQPLPLRICYTRTDGVRRAPR